MRYSLRLLLVILFAIAMAYVESAVVVYLRGWFYPDGFSMSLRMIPEDILFTEIGREAATIVMLVTIAWVAARSGWEWFGYFLIVFGVWDIFYYVWLKVLIDWPASLLEMDVLFLIPVPWLGPVLAPCLIAALMTAVGVMITRRIALGGVFRSTVLSWFVAIAATVTILYSFTNYTLPVEASDVNYAYWLLALGLLGYGAAFAHAYFKSREWSPPEGSQ